MDNIQKQLIAKLGEEFTNIFPLQYVSNILDKATGETLTILLSRYNHIFIPFTGEKEITRAAVPPIMRRKGLYITYITPNSEIITEYFKGNKTEVNNEDWVKDKNWGTNLTSDNFVPITLPDGSVTAEKLSQEVLDLIGQGFKGNIENHPDGEDLTSTELATVGNTKYKVLKFADRNYTQDGMGYVILRKNKTFAAQVTKSNTIYEIRYNFDLDGDTVNIPDNCVLKFEGGTIINGELRGKILNDFISPEWFGAKGDNNHDDTLAIQRAVNLAKTSCRKVILRDSIYKITDSIIIPDRFELCSERKTGDKLLDSYNIIQYSKDKNIITIVPESVQPNNINIHDISLVYNDVDSTTNGNGIHLDVNISNKNSALQSSVFENLTIRNARYAIYIHTVGYLGIMWNIFRNLNLYRNVIGFYLNGELGGETNRKCWVNHNSFEDCHISQNKIGGIYAICRQVETLNIVRCNIQECGREYTVSDYNNFGVNAINVQADFGGMSIEGCYFERNYPYTTSRISEDQVQFGTIYCPPAMEDNLLINDIYTKSVSTIITENHFALINPAVTIEGNVNLQMHHNELNIETVTITENKLIARVGSLNSQGNYSSVTINEPGRFNITGSSPIVSVVNVRRDYINLKYDVNFPVFNCIFKSKGSAFEGNVNLYIDNQDSTATGNGLSIYRKAKFIRDAIPVTSSTLDNTTLNLVLTSLYNDRTYNASTGTFIANCNINISSTDSDKRWEIGTSLFDMSNGTVVFNNINFDMYSTTISAIFFRFRGITRFIFNNCVFTGKSSPMNFTIIGCYANSVGSIEFNRCSFIKGTTGINSNIRIVKYIEGNPQVRVGFNNCTFDDGNYSCDGINEDGTLLNKVLISSNIQRMNLPNIIYKIVSDIDLQGETLTLPSNCTLDFQGGSFSNGTIVGSNTKINAGLDKIFNTDIIISGTWNVNEAYPEWFGATIGSSDSRLAIQLCLNSFNTTKLSLQTYTLNSYSDENTETRTCLIIPNGHSLIGNRIYELAQTDYTLQIAERLNPVYMIRLESNSSIKNLYICGNTISRDNGAICIGTNGFAKHLFLENVLVRWGAYGFSLKTFLSTITNCQVANSNIGFRIYGDTPTNSFGTSTTLIGCYCIGIINTCYQIESMIYSSIIDCACDSSGLNTDGTISGNYIYDIINSRNISINNCGIEICPLLMQFRQGCRNIDINGGIFTINADLDANTLEYIKINTGEKDINFNNLRIWGTNGDPLGFIKVRNGDFSCGYQFNNCYFGNNTKLILGSNLKLDNPNIVGNVKVYYNDIPNKGLTSVRPTLTNDNLYNGFIFFDLTLKKYICWNGTAWTNLDGTALT